jgi:hypothetical protein
VAIDLSILICSTHTRWEGFGQAIQRQIWDQYNALPEDRQKRVEIIMLTDNKKMMLGQKRNVMVDMAQGKYVAFVDDDDRLEPEYLTSLLIAADTDADVLCFLVSVSMNGEPPKLCLYSLNYDQDRNLDDAYQRLPNHICAVKRELARQVSFPNIAYGEDSGYSKLLRPLLKTEAQIPKILYHYDYHSDSTETQLHLNASVRVRNNHPIVDLIMLSNATNTTLRGMTQIAIRTAIAGANSLPVNVIVLEQQPNIRYQYATTVHAPEPFHYNQFANRGAELGQAQWIVVANNDLIFRDGWLHHLLAAEHPVVSPKNPGDERQPDLFNAKGYVNGRHFSGWCFMIRRDIWAKIGGLDRDFGFWCADDAVIEQLRAVDVTPMIVPAAEVIHQGSVTLKALLPDNDALWAAVELFNAKYDQEKFVGDARYTRWRQDRVLR